jgi:molecular chaperone GrpE
LEEKDIDENGPEVTETRETAEKQPEDKTIIEELNNKYLRLYAEFDNYKKKVNRDKEELAKYGNESLIYELLPIIDSLELALKHAQEDSRTGIVQGVEMTLKELYRTLEKFGVSKIEAAGKPFDPSIHHAMAQVERKDMDEKMVAEEMRSGYIYREKVLRPSLVSVSRKPQDDNKNKSDKAGEKTEQEEAGNPEEIEINIHNKIQED